jgi:hypothetical protein
LQRYVTGAPLPSDSLHFAVPVVAPYTALQSARYKVKLTPGKERSACCISCYHEQIVSPSFGNDLSLLKDILKGRCRLNSVSKQIPSKY